MHYTCYKQGLEKKRWEVSHCSWVGFSRMYSVTFSIIFESNDK